MKVFHLTPAAVICVQFGALAVGMASWLDDDEDGGDSGSDDEFDVDGTGEFDDDFDDDFGSFDDMDGGDGAGAQDASVNELEHRIEELETEVSSVASKANTVRSENEQINESVEDVEENVRKLLEIYEMVTRGVNPFVDDVNADAMDGGSESFGLFDDANGGADESAEELDEDIAAADADDFFEDDTFDEDLEGEMDDDLEAGETDDDFEEFDGDAEPGSLDDEVALEDEGSEFDNESEPEDADGGGQGTSFEELKQEYESGKADWAQGDDAGESDALGDEEDALDDGGEPDDGDALDGDEGPGPEAEAAGLGFDDSDLTDGAETPADSDPDTGGFEFGSTTADSTNEFGEAPGAPSVGMASRNDGPHLAEPPTGYLSDVVALEWLDHLLSEFGAKNTVRTLNYYERIGWIGEPVRDQLIDYMDGLTDSDYLYREEFGTTDLTKDDHMESLEYIDELASENIERAIVDRFDDLHRNGIQR